MSLLQKDYLVSHDLLLYATSLPPMRWTLAVGVQFEKAGLPSLQDQMLLWQKFVIIEKEKKFYAFEFLSQNHAGPEAVAQLGAVWRSGGELTSSILAVVESAPHLNRSLVLAALFEPSESSIFALCEVLLQPLQERYAPSRSLRREATRALANPSYDGVCLRALSAVASTDEVVLALLRGSPAGALLSACFHATARAEFIAGSRADARCLLSRAIRGLSQPLNADEAFECLRCRACLQDATAAAIGLCAADKDTILRIPRVRSALSEVLIDLLEIPDQESSHWPNFKVGGREHVKLAWIYPMDFDLISTGRGLLSVTEAVTESEKLRHDLSWVKVEGCTIPDNLYCSLPYNVARNSISYMGSVLISVKDDLYDTEVSKLLADNQVIAEVNWELDELSLPPCTACPHMRQSLALAANSQAFKELEFICKTVGAESCGTLLFCASRFLQKDKNRSIPYRGRDIHVHDAKTPEEFSYAAAHLSLEQVHELLKISTDFRKCLVIRVMCLRLLGATCGQAAEGSHGSHWGDCRPELSAHRTASIEDILALVQVINPETEALAMVLRAVTLIGKDWLCSRTPSGRIPRGIAEPLCDKHVLADEDTVLLRAERQKLAEIAAELAETDGGLRIGESEHVKKMGCLFSDRLSIEAATRCLGSASVKDLITWHNHLDFYGMEVRRRMVSQALLIRIFGRAPTCSDLAAFVLSKGGLTPPEALPFVQAVLGALPKRKRYRC